MLSFIGIHNLAFLYGLSQRSYDHFNSLRHNDKEIEVFSRKKIQCNTEKDTCSSRDKRNPFTIIEATPKRVN